ncbi:hypothetical protein UT300019_10640 [Clostridium sp. CTA-19]
MKIKNILNWMFSSIQVGIIIFGIVIHQLSTKKMGVMRSLIYRNHVWNSKNIDKTLICILMITAVILLIITIYNYKKNKVWNIVNFIILILNILAIMFMTKLNSDLILSYYVLSMSITIVFVIEVLKKLLLKQQN